MKNIDNLYDVTTEAEAVYFLQQMIERNKALEVVDQLKDAEIIADKVMKLFGWIDEN